MGKTDTAEAIVVAGGSSHWLRYSLAPETPAAITAAINPAVQLPLLNWPAAAIPLRVAKNVNRAFAPILLRSINQIHLPADPRFCFHYVDRRFFV